MRRAKRGRTAPSTNPDPGDNGTLWGVDIDWSEPPVGAAISEETARELVKVLPASLVQAAADFVAGDGAKIQAWRMARAKRPSGDSAGHGRPIRMEWDAIFGDGQAPDTDRGIAAAIGTHHGVVSKERQRRNIPPHPRSGGGERAPQIEIDGELATLAEWSKRAGLPRRTLTNRWSKGKRGRELLAPLMASKVRRASGPLPTRGRAGDGVAEERSDGNPS